MRFSKYQEKAAKLASYPKGQIKGLLPAMYACEEGQEVLRCFRVAFNKEENLDEEALKEEMGDCLVSLAYLAVDMGFSLDDIATASLDKQKQRQKDRDEGII